MPVTLNLKVGVDLPVYQWLRFLPVTSAAGHCLCTDRRGTSRFVYLMCGVTSFWRYDTWTDSYEQLASPGSLGGSGTWGAGTCMVFDASQGSGGRVWLLNGYSTQCGFGFYDIASNAWTTRSVTNLPMAWGTDGAMAHTCTSYNGAGNDDYLYLIGNGNTPFYRYSIVGNSWSVMANACTYMMSGGCSLHWVFGFNTALLYALRGGSNTTVLIYNIGAPGWSTLSYTPGSETFTTGSTACYDGVDRIYIVKDATHRMFYLDLTNSVLVTAGMWPYTAGTAYAGDGLIYIKTADGAKYLYYRRLSGTEFWRTLIGWY